MEEREREKSNSQVKREKEGRTQGKKITQKLKKVIVERTKERPYRRCRVKVSEREREGRGGV